MAGCRPVAVVSCSTFASGIMTLDRAAASCCILITRNDHVQSVVPAVQLDQDQNAVGCSGKR